MIQYSWAPPSLNDLQAIRISTESNCADEITSIWTIDEIAFYRNMTLAIVNQHYTPNHELLQVARDNAGTIIAYTWARANERMPWSDESMVVIRMAHVDLRLSPRVRLRLLSDMLHIWETFARQAGAVIISSCSMRREQDAYLRLHQRHGYEIRGSYAYKKLSA
jgi:hypothetical protein